MNYNLINKPNCIGDASEMDNAETCPNACIQLNPMAGSQLANPDLFLTLQRYIGNGIADALESNPELRNGGRFAVELGPTLLMSSMRIEYIPDSE